MEGQAAWRASLTPDQKALIDEKASKARQISKLKSEIRKLKSKKIKTVSEMKITTPRPSDEPLPSTGPDVFVREEVRTFSHHMEHKLRKRDGYGGWRNLPLPYIKEKLKGELNELLVALEYETTPEVMSECVDVANYVMFLWDIMRSGDPRTEVSLVGRTKDQGRT